MLGNASEMPNEWKTYLTNRGIKPCQTAPYSLEMNDIAERLIRILVDRASAMSWAAQLPMAFWAADMFAANFLHHRSPTSALESETPFEGWYGQKPNLGFI